ncbi:tyrosine-type recombinase/integrase [Chamaesiphon minutus]|uniref:Site-specific recombinase XerD n=1 Tax=Chamaesiphon minutus (strain ATCC 27169 / PCC 6605) TaxID=1173020 RepID=K9UCY5_CHAP6|nr:tyrosine-type recombinase/integrase [Chamaesiphon minutus]AFY92690.1 site-specific recombinase XerD [Chamaesiphon minutus PCC 6605]
MLNTPTPQLIRFQQPSPAELTTIERDNLWAEFGQLKIADSTRKQYVKAIENFCQFAYSGSATPETISEFLKLDRYAAIEMVLRYRRHSIDKNLAPSTINVRLAAIKSLVDMVRKLGKTTIDLGDIESIPAETYRDTRGISVEQFKLMLEAIDPSTSIGVRDYAIMLLFWGNALRRGEIASANIEDFLPQQQKLTILGKGKRVKVAIDLTDSVSYALEEWLNFHPCNAPGQPLSCRTQPGGFLQVDAPLIVSLSHNCYGSRIAGDSIYRIVQGYAEAAGIERRVSPHRLRHSSITAFLDASGGNLRAAQALSRHSNQNTLNLYDDNRRQEQKGASGMLEDLLVGTGGKTSD